MNQLFPGGEDDVLRTDVTRLQVQVAQLLADKNVGNVVYGGPIRTFVATSTYSTVRIRDLDASFPFDFKEPVKEWILRILACDLRITPGPIRSSVSVSLSATATPSGGSSTTTSGGGSTSGASSIATTSAGGGSTSGSSNPQTAATGDIESLATEHHHKWGDYVSDGAPGYTNRNYGSFGGSVPPTTPDTGININTNATNDLLTGPHLSSASKSMAGADHVHNNAHTHTTPNHFHTIEHTHTTPNHTHATPDHTHPTHTHDLTLGIAESGGATGIHLWIDGVDRTVELGGPWSAEVELDIRPYLITDYPKVLPDIGLHDFRITSATVGSVEVQFSYYVIAKPVH